MSGSLDNSDASGEHSTEALRAVAESSDSAQPTKLTKSIKPTSAPSGRGRGRPSLGKTQQLVYIDDAEKLIAFELGNGKISPGIRVALQLARLIGVEQTKALVNSPVVDDLPSDVVASQAPPAGYFTSQTDGDGANTTDKAQNE